MPAARSPYSSAAPGKGVRVRAEPVNVRRIICPTRWTPVSRMVSSTSEMTPNFASVTGDQDLERRDLRIGDAAVLVGELDSPAGPRGCEPSRLWLQAHPEVAVGVGDGLDGRARDGDPQGNTRQVVGQEPLHGTAHGGADALALHGLGGERVVEDPSAHHHPLVTSVADVRLDAEVDRRSGAGSPQPRPVPGLLQPAGPTTRTHGHTLGRRGRLEPSQLTRVIPPRSVLRSQWMATSQVRKVARYCVGVRPVRSRNAALNADREVYPTVCAMG